jgi:hypothetical protein
MAQQRTDGRLASIETNYQRLAEDVHGTASALEKHVERTSLALETLNNKINSSRVPQWSALASWAAIILTIVALLLSGYGEDQGRLETGQKTIFDKLQLHENAAQETKIKVGEIKSEYDALKQYEILDLKNKVQELETRLRELECGKDRGN